MCQSGAMRAVIISTAGRSAVGAVNCDEMVTSFVSPAGSNGSTMPTPKSRFSVDWAQAWAMAQAPRMLPTDLPPTNAL